MSVSSVTPQSISQDQQANAAVERTVAVLKKQQDVAEAQGAALIALIEAVPTGDVGSRISVYA
jgi:hypothetical protein